MTTFECIQLFLGSGGLLGILILTFRMGKVVQKIETLDQKIDKLEKTFCENFTEIKNDIKDMKGRISAVELQIGRLEIRVEERTLRVVKDIYESREPAVR